MSSDSSNDNQTLPPWLRDVALPPRPPAAGEQPAPQPQAEQGKPEPDWLRADASPAPAADAGQLPDWLRDRSAEPAPASNAEQLPSWLLDIAGASTPAEASDPLPSSAPPATPTPAAEAGGLPDWLRESQRDAAAPGPEQLPDWLRDIAGAPPAADSAPSLPAGQDQLASASASEGADLPDWLRDQSQATTPAAPTLQDLFGDRDQAAPPPANRAAAPDWLGDPATAEARPATPGSAQSEPTVPDWLQDISAGSDDSDDIDSAVEPFSFEGATGAPAESDAPSLPAWLGSPEEADTGASMPDWLSSTSDQPASAGDDATAGAPSWLASAAGLAAPEPGTAPNAPEVPLWLQDTDQGADGGAAPSAGLEDNPPAWLQDPSAEPAASTPSQETTPAWLQDLPAEPASADAPPWLQQTVATPPADDALPAWLQETPADASSPPADSAPTWTQDSSPATSAAGDLPAWLQDVPPTVEAAASEAAPAWLHDTAGAPPGTQAASPPPDIPAEPDALPDWLRPSSAPQAPPASAEQDIPPWLRDEAGQPLPSAGAPGDTNLPSWLRGATLDRAPAAESSPAQPAPETPTSGSNFDWFEDSAAPALPTASAGSANDQLVGGIELPAWLRPPEPEQPKEISPTDARSLDWLTRLGGQEEEEAPSAAVTEPARRRSPAAPARTAAQIEAIALLQRLAAEPYPVAAPAPEQAAPSVWRRFGAERLLYLALLIALVLALALPVSGSLGLDAPPTAPGAADLFAQIDRLSENDTVLVGYEWDARRSGELRPLEQAVMSHLLRHKVKLVLLSTDAQGTLLMFDLRDELSAAGYKPSGEDYLLLGYKPGAELALRSFAQDFRGALRSDFQGNDATVSNLATDASGQPRLNRLGDFAMVLVLADEPADVQGWMEQVHPSARRADGSFVPFGFLLPAETAPIVQPYLSAQRGVYHLAGRQGALAYQQLEGAPGTNAAQLAGEAGRQRLSLLVYATLFVIGALAVGIGGALARGRKRP